MLKIRRSYFPILASLFTVMLMVFGVEVKGQQIRVYADGQNSGSVTSVLPVIGSGTITNNGSAVDAVPTKLETYSQLSCASLLTIGQNVWQGLKFSTPFSKNLPVHIKFTTEIPLNVLSTTTINLQAYSANSPIGSKVTLSSGILGLIGGVNMLDYVMPAPGGTGNYDEIRLTLQVGGVVGTCKVGIYAAYHYDTPTGLVVCDQKTDYIHGVTGANLLSGVNNVSDPKYAIDNDRTTPALLEANLSVLSTVFETALYNTPSKPGDSVRIVFKNGGNGLLDLTLLASSFTVGAYSDNTLITTMANQSSLLKLNLLSGSSDIQILSFPVKLVSFDRIRVSIGDGLAQALSALYLYEIERIAPTPIPTATGMVGASLTKCYGDAISINISSPETNAKYRWFDAQTGGNEISTGLNINGTTFSPTNLTPGTYTYYVSLSRNGCSDEMSDRAKVTLIIKKPTLSSPLTSTICSGTSFNYTPTTDASTPTFTWTRAAVFGISNQEITTAQLGSINETLINTTSNTIQVIYVYNLTGDGCSNTQNLTVTVNPTPSISLSPPPPVCGSRSNFNLNYTNPLNAPTTYSINWDSSAETAGWVDENTPKPLPVNGTIPITVPTNISPNIYHGTLRVYNTTCSKDIPLDITIYQSPPSPAISISN